MEDEVEGKHILTATKTTQALDSLKKGQIDKQNVREEDDDGDWIERRICYKGHMQQSAR